MDVVVVVRVVQLTYRLLTATAYRREDDDVFDPARSVSGVCVIVCVKPRQGLDEGK